MAKFCQNCGKELDDNAAMCISCGKLVNGGNTITSNTANTNSNNIEKKKKGLPVWAIILIVIGSVALFFVLVIIIIASIGYKAIKNVDDIINDIDNYVDESMQTISGTIGDTLTSENFKMTLTDALIYTSVEGQYYTDTPEEGKEYLVYYFDIENISDESQHISMYDFQGYEEGYLISNENAINDINGVKGLSVDLDPGKTTTGFVVYEVSTTWKKSEVRFSDGIWGNGKTLVFKVENENNQGA